MAADDPGRGFGFLVHDVARLLRRAFDRRAGRLGLTRAQWSVIAHLKRRGEGINQAALADLVEIAPITLARLLDRMAAAGWIERRPDPVDRRARRLFLTERARAEFGGMRRMAREVRAEALAGFSAEEVAALMDALGRIKANLAAGGEDRAAESGRATSEPGERSRQGARGGGRASR